MFMYFPDNYVWSMAAVAALNNGGYIDEVDRACRPVLEASEHGDDSGTELLYASWAAVADRLIAKAQADEAAGRRIGAGETYYRASLYTSQAERLQSPDWEGRNAAYQKSIDLLLKHVELSEIPLTPIEVPCEEGSLPGYYHRAPGPGPHPVVIQFNGLDSTKEMMYYSGFPSMLAARGISTLMIDTGGSGEALRLRGITARHDTEHWAAAIIDWLESNADGLDIEPGMIGIVGWSLGGYYAPRAAAFESRLRFAVAWGANHDWAEVQRARRRREGENPVPHYWKHVFWVWGATDMDDFVEKTRHMHLNGVAEQITVPLLITHGADDRQIPVAYAHQTYDQAVRSPKRQLRVFSDAEGGNEHISIDNLPYAGGMIADWIAETVHELGDQDLSLGANRESRFPPPTASTRSGTHNTGGAT